MFGRFTLIDNDRMSICRPNLRLSSISDQRTSPRRIFRQRSRLPPPSSTLMRLPTESASSQEFEGHTTFNRQLRPPPEICNSGRGAVAVGLLIVVVGVVATECSDQVHRLVLFTEHLVWTRCRAIFFHPLNKLTRWANIYDVTTLGNEGDRGRRRCSRSARAAAAVSYYNCGSNERPRRKQTVVVPRAREGLPAHRARAPGPPRMLPRELGRMRSAAAAARGAAAGRGRARLHCG